MTATTRRVGGGGRGGATRRAEGGGATIYISTESFDETSFLPYMSIILF
jgi:hypothetical protein